VETQLDRTAGIALRKQLPQMSPEVTFGDYRLPEFTEVDEKEIPKSLRKSETVFGA